jgi:anhydro-N-acetylmuramic acid kinase
MPSTAIYHVIGLMSGSSLDGLDIAYCMLKKKYEQWNFEIIEAETFAYSSALQQKLATLHLSSAKELMQQDAELAALWATMIKDFIAKNKIKKVDFIASHGHTIFHEPQNNFSTQIGNGAAIAALTGISTVCDFRSTDVALGGQGAPLVPMGDLQLFHEFDACLNLGGICNITIEIAGENTNYGAKDSNLGNGNFSAFDIAPCNQLLNFFAKELGKDFDENGNFASNGKVNQSILQQLNDLDFYKNKTSKSLSNQYSNTLIEILQQENSTENKLRTAVEHIDFQISDVLNSNKNNFSKKCLVTGGGAFNSFLIETLKSKTDWEIIIPDKKLIAFKEALIFAFLGVLRWRNETNVLKKITAATKDSCSGAIYFS